MSISPEYVIAIGAAIMTAMTTLIIAINSQIYNVDEKELKVKLARAQDATLRDVGEQFKKISDENDVTQHKKIFEEARIKLDRYKRCENAASNAKTNTVYGIALWIVGGILFILSIVGGVFLTMLAFYSFLFATLVTIIVYQNSKIAYEEYMKLYVNDSLIVETNYDALDRRMKKIESILSEKK